MMSTEERLARVEEAFVMLTRLVQGLDERMDTHLTWINSLGEAQANSDAKIAALADAQIRTEAAQANSETKIAALTDAQIRTEEVLARLGEAQSHADQRLEALADAQMRTEAALTRLAESQAHTDQKLDALIKIVRESRNGKSET